MDAMVTVLPGTSQLLGFLVATTSTQVLFERALGTFSYVSDQVTVAEQSIGRVGALVVSTDAASIGISAIPDPHSNSDAPWWMFRTFMSSGTSNFNTVGNPEIDVRARRILNANEAMAFVVSNQHATHTFLFGINLRILARIR